MKLEEVLPAMREGRVAVFRITRYKLIDGLLQFWSPMEGLWKKSENLANDMLDGWTLEPEPKVEWPKGSFQRAMEAAGAGGFIRRKSWDSRVKYSHRQCCGTWCGEPFDTLALDWEVVP